MLPGTCDTFFKDLEEVYYQGHSMTEKCMINNAVYELFYDGKPCGYTVCINNADAIKRNSSLFVDVDYMFLDEFQSETGKYVSNEVQKFISIYTSVARGGGKQYRYVTVLMASNTVSMMNPYYIQLGIDKRLKPETKFLRGKGFVLEITFNENAANELMSSPIGRAFGNTEYMKYSVNNEYLNDSREFISSGAIHGELIGNLLYKGMYMGIWQTSNFLTISEKYNPTINTIVLDSASHKVEMKLENRRGNIYKLLAEAYRNGVLLFDTLKCKTYILEYLGINKQA